MLKSQLINQTAFSVEQIKILVYLAVGKTKIIFFQLPHFSFCKSGNTAIKTNNWE
jgi:hypothetical protein